MHKHPTSRQGGNQPSEVKSRGRNPKTLQRPNARKGRGALTCTPFFMRGRQREQASKREPLLCCPSAGPVPTVHNKLVHKPVKSEARSQSSRGQPLTLVFSVGTLKPRYSLSSKSPGTARRGCNLAKYIVQSGIQHKRARLAVHMHCRGPSRDV